MHRHPLADIQIEPVLPSSVQESSAFGSRLSPVVLFENLDCLSAAVQLLPSGLGSSLCFSFPRLAPKRVSAISLSFATAISEK
jgi:hypothetical protein